MAFKQAVGLHLAQVVAESIEGVGLLGDPEAREKDLVDMASAPTVDLGPRVKQDFHQPDHARVVDFDSGDAGRPLLYGSSQAFQE